MSELQRFVWEWPSLLDRLRALNPAIGDLLARSTRPLETERRPDGRLLLVLGCWVPADRVELNEPRARDALDRGFRQLLGEPIVAHVTDWPAGNGSPDHPPDPLDGLPEPLRSAGSLCGGALWRSFFAAAAKRGIIFECQYPVLNYRLDFALPRLRLGVEIGGWSWRSWTSANVIDRREREQGLNAEGWTILWFTGEEILHQIDRSLDQVVRLVSARQQSPDKGSQPYPGRNRGWRE